MLKSSIRAQKGDTCAPLPSIAFVKKQKIQFFLKKKKILKKKEFFFLQQSVNFFFLL